LYKNTEIRRAVDEIYKGQLRAGILAVTTLADIRAQYAGYRRYMKEIVYGLLINESPFTTVSEKEQFYTVSNDRHRSLQFQSAHNQGRFEPRVEGMMVIEREAAELRRYR
jgi:hypothetical protein